MACEYETARYERIDRPPNINCSIVDMIVGHRCSTPLPVCDRCKYHETGDDTVIREVAKQHLHAALVSGDLPKWPDPIDIKDEFAQYASLSTRQEQIDLLEEMLLYQSAIAEEDGGHPESVLEAKLNELATIHDLIGDLEALRLKYE